MNNKTLTSNFVSLVSAFWLINSISSVSANSQLDIKKNIRDPFISPTGFEEVNQEEEEIIKKLPFTIEIKGIVMTEGRHYAILNDSIVKEKDTWEGLAIEEIGKDYVCIVYGEKKIKIPVKKGKTKD